MTVLHQLFLQTQRELFDASASEYENYATELAATLFDHAWRNVPAYRKRFATLVKDESFDLLDWDRLPVLRPHEFQAQTSLYSAETLPTHAQEFELMSPNPALPLMRRSIATRIAIECDRELACELHDLDLSSRMAILHPRHTAGSEGKGWSVTFPGNSWVSMAVDAPTEQRVAWLADSGARILRTTDAQALEIANAAAGRGIVLDGVIVADQTLSPHTRGAVAEAFNSRLVHLVELPAIGPVAVSAPDNDGYIAAAGAMMAEVVGDDGRRLVSGQTGELVVTPLYEYATPLIRYATGIRAIADARQASRLGLWRLRELGEQNQ
jgi:phenylacetate-CoA ligase